MDVNHARIFLKENKRFLEGFFLRRTGVTSLSFNMTIWAIIVSAVLRYVLFSCSLSFDYFSYRITFRLLGSITYFSKLFWIIKFYSFMEGFEISYNCISS